MDNTVIERYFSLTELQKEQFGRMGELYAEWNAKINVISRKDIENIYPHHILHSLAIARFINPADGTAFLDMGCGGGFPGIPLATLWPHCRFHLIDRIAKKIRVAEDVARSLGLENVTFQHGDIGECRERYDFVVSRAVMAMGELLPLVRKNIARECRNGYPNGVIALKGGDLRAEMSTIRQPYIEEDLSRYFQEDYFKTKKLVYVDMMS